MKILITGGHGFLGWHTACRLRASRGWEPVRPTRAEVSDPAALRALVDDADAILHLAGVNRAESDEAVREGNIDLARRLADAVSASSSGKRLVYANSIQAELDNAYGQGKAIAAGLLRDAAGAAGGSLADVRLPNLFGEHGRPGYNSFVATFCDAVAHGRTPAVTGDRVVELLHSQRAAESLIQELHGTTDIVTAPAGEPRGVAEVLHQLQDFRQVYLRGEIPPLLTSFDVDLFNTYRSFVFPQGFPIHPQAHVDDRGLLVETVRTHGGTGQSFVSTTNPGATRGNHYHLNKIERFFVVRGLAEIRLRRLLDDVVVTFDMDGSNPGFVDMPTMWVHSITNVGDDDLITTFWADQLLDPVSPDQYPEDVIQERAS
jgi:UDP-2-acetamido-2,6-beta-L-arabino-hexul-4-ose reductase